MKKSRIPGVFLKMDHYFPSGVYTAEKKDQPHLDMKAMRDYCKKENRDYASLTDSELQRFVVS